MPPADVVRARPPIGAFFDMDKTLICENSGSLYMKHRYQRGEIDGVELLKGIGAYLQYKLGILDIRNWTKNMMLQFRGRSEAELEKEALQWFDEMVAETIYPEAEQLVREHAAAGHVVAIVSGATKFVVRPLAARLGIEHMLYTRLEVEDGLFTGRVIEPICFEEGKIYWLQQFIEEQGIDLAKSWFYTDSITDRALLDLIGHPVAVNPDPLLYLEAVRRCWPVRFFDPPLRAARR
ncbi:MAG: HAD-IB family hydrolase [Myxococcales bacterium]|nr:HAD-IB family hydrolase [Myxococcales bacterium]MDH5307505.1 HAD-IB family hydrolase [Myxococcales bacterium]MDH5566835.1 HAD-IB family hydrolase [Myxococcales bacterium]